MSIRSRLTGLLLRLIVPLMVLMGALFYGFVRGELMARFDDGLLMRARALSGMVVVEAGRFELEFAGESMPQYAATAGDEYFEVTALDGPEARRVIERSESLGSGALDAKVPVLATAVWNAALPDGASGRFLSLRYKPIPNSENEQDEPTVTARAAPYGGTLLFVVAQSRKELDDTLNLLGGSLVIALLLLIGGTLLAVRLALVRGLAPVEKLASTIESISPDDLSQRILAPSLPQELAPIAQRTNQLLDRLAMAFDREKKLAAGAAHEMRTPIAELRAVTELALSRERNAAEYRRSLESVRETTLRMGAAADAVLRLARVQSGRETLTLESIDLGEAIQNIWSRLIEPLEGRGIQRGMEIERGVRVRADRAMLGVIFENLFANAAAHASNGGEVRVHCEGRDPRHLLCIVGNSIAPDARPDPGGEMLHVGLGLHIAGSLCEVLGGTMTTARSISHFTVTLELQRA